MQARVHRHPVGAHRTRVHVSLMLGFLCCVGVPTTVAVGDDVTRVNVAQHPLAAQPWVTGGMRIDYPPLEAHLRRDRLALYIGINRYRDPETGNLEGCVNDVLNMKQIFEERFGFERIAVRTDEHATREGLKDAFVSLVDQVRAFRGVTDNPISVLIFYSGHGSQVQDQPREALGRDEDDGFDETWVAFDSSRTLGENDIRDDDIELVCGALTDLGASVLLISDSCHSGHIHRGQRTFAARRVYRVNPPQGPVEALFPELVHTARVGARGTIAGLTGGLIDREPPAGFAVFTACRAREEAQEHEDDLGVPCGRFTYVLRQILPDLPAGTTNVELHERIAAAFDHQFVDRLQMPQFSANTAKRGEVFVEGGWTPLHATIVPHSQQRDTLQLTMGRVHGVDVGAVFEFYEDLEALAERRDPMARAEAMSVEVNRCTVRLDGQTTISPLAKARLDRVRLTDCKVFVLESVPTDMQEQLTELAADRRLHMAESAAESDVVVSLDATQQYVGIYSPNALPDPGAPESHQPDPIRPLFPASSGSTDDLIRELLYLGRMQRLMSLEHNEDRILVELVVSPDEAEANGTPTGPGPVEDPRRVQVGHDFALRFTNNMPVPLYPTVIYASPSGEVMVLFPGPSEEPVSVAARATYEIPGFGVEIEDDEAVARYGYELCRLKIIASGDPMDFHSLTRSPTRRSRSAVTPRNPLEELMADVLHGGGSTRGGAGHLTSVAWTTSSVVFGIEPRGAPLRQASSGDGTSSNAFKSWIPFLGMTGRERMIYDVRAVSSEARADSGLLFETWFTPIEPPNTSIDVWGLRGLGDSTGYSWNARLMGEGVAVETASIECTDPSAWMKTLTETDLRALPVPMQFAVRLANSATFLAFADTNARWDAGFEIPHPNMPGATLVGTTAPCTAAGMTGHTVTMRLNGQDLLQSCLSPQCVLPVSLREFPPPGAPSTFEAIEYTLASYTQDPVESCTITKYEKEPIESRGTRFMTEKVSCIGPWWIPDLAGRTTLEVRYDVTVARSDGSVERGTLEATFSPIDLFGGDLEDPWVLSATATFGARAGTGEVEGERSDLRCFVRSRAGELRSQPGVGPFVEFLEDSCRFVLPECVAPKRFPQDLDTLSSGLWGSRWSYPGDDDLELGVGRLTSVDFRSPSEDVDRFAWWTELRRRDAGVGFGSDRWRRDSKEVIAAACIPKDGVFPFLLRLWIRRGDESYDYRLKFVGRIGD